MTQMNDATKRQVQAAQPNMSTWLSANAGSGKTRVLTDRVARLLLQGVSPENILCLTYTKAAATEMQNRLFERLGSWAMQPNDTLRRALTEMGVDDIIDDTALRQARTLFAKAIETPGGLKIQTIHSFCGAVLRQFPREAGVSPQFMAIDERVIKQLCHEILEMLASDANALGVMSDITRLAGDHGLPKVVQAILAKRDIFAQPRTPQGIFQNFGLDDVVDQVADIQAHFDADDLRLVRELVAILAKQSGKDLAAAQKLQHITQIDTAAIITFEDMFLNGLTGKNPLAPKIDTFPNKATREGPAAALMDDLNDLMQRVRDYYDRRRAISDAYHAVTLHRFAGVFLARYAHEKQLRGWLDFEDLILKTRDLLNTPAVAEWVLYRLDGGIDHILVDEAQDTSPAQWNVIEHLTQEFTTGQGARSNTNRTIFVVGDKKQSIYSFQGADPDEFDRMRDVFQQRLDAISLPFQPLTLDFSFRSSAAILRVVDAVFDGRGSSGFSTDSVHRAFNTELPGRVDLWPVIEEQKTDKDQDWETPIDRRAPSDHRVILAEQIAAQIDHMIKSGTMIPDKDGPRPVRAGDFLILVQRRKEMFSEIIRACKSRGLPMAGADRLNLQSELAVRDLISLLSFLVTPEDDFSLATILKSPLFGWDEQRLFTLAHYRSEKYLWAAMRAKPDEYSAELAVLNDLRSQTDFLRPYDLLERVLIKHQGRKRWVGRVGAECIDGIDALLAQALTYEQTEVPSLTGFISWFSSDDLQIKRQMDANSDQIRVMSVHGSKGLESPIVILPDCGKREVPVKDSVIQSDNMVFWKSNGAQRGETVNQAIAARQDVETYERDRLLYVAMTRAEKWLIIAAAGKLGGTPPSWYEQIAIGMEKSGAIDYDFPTGLGKRVQHLDWPEPTSVAADQNTTKPLPELDAWAHTHAPAPTPIRTSLSPSDLGGAKALGGDLGQSADAAMVFGSKVHILLEHLPNHPPPDWDHIAPHILSAAGYDPDPDAIHQAKSVITTPALQYLFGPDVLAEVAVSAQLDHVGDLPIYGVIDRLVIAPDHVQVVDFKSNATVPDTADEIPLGIVRQMAAYGLAMQAIYPDRQVCCAIVWTTTATVMEIPQTLWQNCSFDPAVT